MRRHVDSIPKYFNLKQLDMSFKGQFRKMENVSTRFHRFEIPLRAALKRGVLNSINFPFVTLRVGGCVCSLKELVHHFVDQINSSSSREVRTDSLRSRATPHLFRKSFLKKRKPFDLKWKISNEISVGTQCRKLNSVKKIKLPCHFEVPHMHSDSILKDVIFDFFCGK